RPPLVPRQPDELPAVPGQGHAHGAPLRVPHRSNVLPVGAAVVHLPGAVHRAAGDPYADGSGVFPAAQPAVSAVAAVASAGGDCAVLCDADAAVPAQAAQRGADLDPGLTRIWRRNPPVAVDDSGNPVLDAVGAGAHAVPYRLRHRGVPWLVGAVEVAATRRQ